MEHDLLKSRGQNAPEKKPKTMKSNHKKAFAKLVSIGCSCYQTADHQNSGTFGISAEDFNWADYYPCFQSGPWINRDIEKILAPLGLYADWECPGALCVCEI